MTHLSTIKVGRGCVVASTAERDAIYSSKGISTQDPGKYTTHLSTIKVGRGCVVAGKAERDALYSSKEKILHKIQVSTRSTCQQLRWGGGVLSPGGGGALEYLGGRIRSLSKLKSTPKALISGQKSSLILIKTLTFSTK